MQTQVIAASTQYPLGGTNPSAGSLITFKTVGLTASCSVIPKYRKPGDGTSNLVAVPYRNVATDVLIAAGTAITADGVYQVSAPGPEVLLDATVSAGTATIAWWIVEGAGGGSGGGGGGGGVGGAVTLAAGAVASGAAVAGAFVDGAITTLGTAADAAVGDASGTVNAHLRQVAKSLVGTVTVGGTVAVSNLPATQPVSGTVAVSGTVPTSIASGQVASGALAAGSIAAGAAVSGALVDGAIATLGTNADAAVGDATGTLNAHARQIAKSLLTAGGLPVNLTTDSTTFSGSKSTVAQITVTSSATVIIAANASRKSVAIINNGTATIYLGNSGVTTSTGFPLPAGAAISDETTTDAWYGIVASTSMTAGVIEVS